MSTGHHARRKGSHGELTRAAALLVAAAALALIAVVVWRVSGGSTATKAPTTTTATSATSVSSPAPAGVETVNMAQATGVDCRTPVAPGKAHPNWVLAQVFAVHDSAGRSYLLGWQIVPYRAAERSYRFGSGGDVLALEPAAGGLPLGYGKGTVTVSDKTDAGELHAVVKLKAGPSVVLSGAWECVTG